MKLNYKNNAISLLLDNNKTRIKELIKPIADEEMIKFLDDFPAIKHLFRKQIHYLCKSFLESYSSGLGKLKEAMDGLSINQDGTLIYPLPDGSFNTLFYSIEATYNEELNVKKGRILMFSNAKNSATPCLAFASVIDEETALVAVNDRLRVPERGVYKNVLSNVAGLITFIKYCPVETKTVVAGSKSIHNNTKFVNQTDLPITILDSTWFTTLVRSEAFAVGAESGGFFRWQACGPGLSERKLMWIFPYEKQGYIRQARVLKDETNGGGNSSNEKTA